MREQVLHLTHEEVPHSVAVLVEEVAQRDTGLLYIRATVFVERDSQEGILIGGGRMLKEIGSRARQRLEALPGTGVYLDPWVKTKRDWRNHEASLRALGYFSTPD